MCQRKVHTLSYVVDDVFNEASIEQPFHSLSLKMGCLLKEALAVFVDQCVMFFTGAIHSSCPL